MKTICRRWFIGKYSEDTFKYDALVPTIYWLILRYDSYAEEDEYVKLEIAKYTKSELIEYIRYNPESIINLELSVKDEIIIKWGCGYEVTDKGRSVLEKIVVLNRLTWGYLVYSDSNKRIYSVDGESIEGKCIRSTYDGREEYLENCEIINKKRKKVKKLRMLFNNCYRIDMTKELDGSYIFMAGNDKTSNYLSRSLNIPSDVELVRADRGDNGYSIISKNIRTVTGGDGIKYIVNEFCSSKGLYSINLEGKGEVYNCFNNCENIEYISLPNVISIKGKCFDGLKNIKGIKIGKQTVIDESVEKILNTYRCVERI